jgi:hypothetical protein
MQQSTELIQIQTIYITYVLEHEDKIDIHDGQS